MYGTLDVIFRDDGVSMFAFKKFVTAALVILSYSVAWKCDIVPH
jgi:hypothetical protein